MQEQQKPSNAVRTGDRVTSVTRPQVRAAVQEENAEPSPYQQAFEQVRHIAALHGFIGLLRDLIQENDRLRERDKRHSKEYAEIRELTKCWRPVAFILDLQEVNDGLRKDLTRKERVKNTFKRIAQVMHASYRKEKDRADNLEAENKRLSNEGALLQTLIDGQAAQMEQAVKSINDLSPRLDAIKKTAERLVEENKQLRLFISQHITH